MTIATRLDQAMRDSRFTSQAALARASGVPQATISRILKGGGKYGPESDTIRKLAQACRVSFQWLSDGTGLNEKLPESTPPPNHDLMSGEQLLRLINFYRLSTEDAKKRILTYAQDEEKIPNILKRVL